MTQQTPMDLIRDALDPEKIAGRLRKIGADAPRVRSSSEWRALAVEAYELHTLLDLVLSGQIKAPTEECAR